MEKFRLLVTVQKRIQRALVDQWKPRLNTEINWEHSFITGISLSAP